MKKLPECWEEVNIKDVAYVDSGQGAPQGESWYSGTKIFVKAKDLNFLTGGKYVGDNCSRITQRAVNEYGLKKYSKNSIVFPKSGMSVKTNNIAMLKDDSYVVNHLAVLEVKDEKKCLPKYLYYYLLKKEISSLSFNPAYPSIRLTDIKNFKIVLSPIEQQERIVRMLDEADRLVQLRQEADSLTDEYLWSVFYEIFGDPITNPKGLVIMPIKEVVAESQYGTSQKSNLNKMGYPLIGMGNITYNGRIDLSSFSYVDIPKTEFEKLKLEKGDVIFNRTNSTELVGKAAYWNIEMNAVIASYLVKIKVNEKMNPIFFAATLNTVYFKKLFQTRCKKAVNQSNISPTLLKTFNVYVPLRELQDEFAEIYQRINRLKETQITSKENINNFFQSILQKAFRGELA